MGTGQDHKLGSMIKKYIKCMNDIVELIYANKILIKKDNHESSRRKHRWIYPEILLQQKLFFLNASCCPEAKRRNINTSGSIKHLTCKIKPEGYQKPRLKANQILKVLFGDIKPNGKMIRGHRQENEQ